MQEMCDESFVSVAPEVFQHQDASALVDDGSVVEAKVKLPSLGDPKGALQRVTSAIVLRTKRHAPNGVPEFGTISRGNLCRDGPLSRLSAPAPPRRVRWVEQRAN